MLLSRPHNGSRRRSRYFFLSAGGRLATTAILLALAGCEDFRYPRDPNDTLEGVLASGRMRALAVDNVPWVVVDNERGPTGAEVALVEAFARDLGVQVQWRRAPAMKAIEALERGEADLAVGGFTKKAVMAHRGAAHTYAYFTEALVVAAKPGAPLPQDVDGREVSVSPDLLANSLVADEGGVPVQSMSETALVALPHWQIPSRDLVPTGIVLHEDEHVIAVPQGENAWIMRLERFLRDQAGDVGALLQAYAP